MVERGYFPPVPPESGEIARLADELTAGRVDTVGSVFSKAGAAAPTIIWTPSPRDLRHPQLRAFGTAARKHQRDDGTFSAAFLESASFEALRDWTMILEPVEEDVVFRYVHYGREIVAVYGRDMTGRTTISFGGHIGLYFSALYIAVARRREMVKSVHEPPDAVFASNWRRLIVPISDEDGSLLKIAVLNVPDNELRAGLEALPDAVLVVAQSGIVCFANRPARDLFSHITPAASGVDVLQFTGMRIDLAAAPEDLIRSGRRHQTRQVMVRDGMIMPVSISIGATYYRDQPFYVLCLRPKLQEI